MYDKKKKLCESFIQNKLYDLPKLLLLYTSITKKKRNKIRLGKSFAKYPNKYA